MSTEIESVVTRRKVTIEGFGGFGPDVAIEIIPGRERSLVISVTRADFLAAVEAELGVRVDRT